MRTGAPPVDRPAGLSLERRLPLLITGVLAACFALALVVAYPMLVRSARSGVGDRLSRLAKQLADLGETGQQARRASLDSVARDPAVRRALASPDPGAERVAAATEALARLAFPADSGQPVELWSTDGRRIAFVGRDLPNDARGEGPDSAALAPGVPRRGLAWPDRVNPASTYGAMFEEGAQVHLWTVAPVPGGAGPAGYVLQERRVRAAPASLRALRALVGEDASIGYRNVDGSLWVSLAGATIDAPTHRDSTADGMVLTRRGAGRTLAAEHRIGGTPLMLVLEMPMGAVLAQPRRAALTLAGACLALLLTGGTAAWVIARRIARPIGSLTRAAEAMARGDFDSRVAADGDGDVARLASSFNRMGTEIGASHRELETRIAEAHSLASRLEESNARLQDSNVRLEQAIGAASEARAEAERARVQAETASRAKSDFLAMMSHELRTPLNAIGGYAELMELELRGPLTGAQRRDLERIRASQEHLLGLISSVLDLSRIESGQLSYLLGPMLLDDFLAGLDALVAPQAEAKSLTLAHVPAGDRLAVMADREKLRQILLNLLSNAIRYTAPGGRITLAAAFASDGMVAISVRDTGVGIPDDAAARIFEPFVQLDRTLTNIRDGIGLGLAISRDLARGMGGELSLASVVGEGSCFTLTLPRADPDEARAMAFTGELPIVRTM